MADGFDCYSSCTDAVSDIANAGYDFVCRYYSTSNPVKSISLPEAQALSRQRVNIVTVWEDGYPTADSYFARPHLGLDHATSAYRVAKGIGQPTNSAIYFAVDYDVQAIAINNIVQYFADIATGFAACDNPAFYQVGVYGSGAVCGAIAGAGLATFTWLAGSSRWRDSTGYPGANILQGDEGTLFGRGITSDSAPGAYGGFLV